MYADHFKNQYSYHIKWNILLEIPYIILNNYVNLYVYLYICMHICVCIAFYLELQVDFS